MSIENARYLVGQANKAKVLEDFAVYMQAAQAMATIVQAEQLTRIADYMEGYLAIYADPAVFSRSDPSDLPG